MSRKTFLGVIPISDLLSKSVENTTDRYKLIYRPKHPFSHKDGYMQKHRWVWEQTHNAILLPWADVHHINGDTRDNRPENLEAMMHKKHCRLSMIGNKNYIRYRHHKGLFI